MGIPLVRKDWRGGLQRKDQKAKEINVVQLGKTKKKNINSKYKKNNVFP